MTGTTTGADRGAPKVRVLFGTERFSSQHSWSELTALMPGALQATVDVQWCPPGAHFRRDRDDRIPAGRAVRLVTGETAASSAQRKRTSDAPWRALSAQAVRSGSGVGVPHV